MLYGKVNADGTVDLADYKEAGYLLVHLEEENRDKGMGFSQITVVKETKDSLYLRVKYRTEDWRTVIEDTGYLFKGHLFSIDTQSISLINAKVTKLLVNPSVNSVMWKPTGKAPVEFTREEFIQFAEEVSDYIESLVLS